MRKNSRKKSAPRTGRENLPFAYDETFAQDMHVNWGTLAENLVVCHADLLDAFLSRRLKDGSVALDVPATLEDVLFCTVLISTAVLSVSDILYLLKDNHNNGSEIAEWASSYDEAHRQASLAISEFLLNNTD